MNKTIIQSEQAPAPIGPYSQAVQCGNLLFISGQIALIPGTDQLDQESLSTETHRVMKNLQAVLTQAGMTFAHVLKTSIFLTDMQFFTEVNQVYATYFSEQFPARETVAVQGLPKGVRVEISMIASLG
ncbi:MAG: Rid family detoxifying hydrolase [Chitinophagaceae bacterium]|jgi:2-iminobutanoate/2-iminopropanoate deaminase|nr:RidA family protein [Bacteroidota bacterium]